MRLLWNVFSPERAFKVKTWHCVANVVNVMFQLTSKPLLRHIHQNKTDGQTIGNMLILWPWSVNFLSSLLTGSSSSHGNELELYYHECSKIVRPFIRRWRRISCLSFASPHYSLSFLYCTTFELLCAASLTFDLLTSKCYMDNGFKEDRKSVAC